MKFCSLTHMMAVSYGTALRTAKPLAAAACLSLLPVQGVASAQSAAPKVSCDSLAKLALPNTTITMAQLVGAGEFQMPKRSSQGGPGGQAGPGGGGFAGPPAVDVKTLPEF